MLNLVIRIWTVLLLMLMVVPISTAVVIPDPLSSLSKSYCLTQSKQEKVPDHLFAIGVSIGGTNIRVGLVSGNGDLKGSPEIFEWRKGAAQKITSEAILDAIMDKIGKVLQNVSDVDQIVKIGIAFAGPVDSEQGVVGTPFPAPNLPFDHYHLAREIEKRYQMIVQNKYGKNQASLVKVSIWNDSHAAVLGEFNQDQGRGQHGMIFILGTGTNGAVVTDGVLYTDNNALLELGFNLVKKKEQEGGWMFTGKNMRGDKPIKHQGDFYNIDLFSGAGIARQFLQYEGAKQAIAKFILLPEDISTTQQLFDIIEKHTSDEEQINALAVNTVLVSITKAVAQHNHIASSFVKELGMDLGRSLAALVRVYYQEPWVEHIILVGSIAEKFSKVTENEDQDIFIHAVRNGFSEYLKFLHDSNRFAVLDNARIEMLAKGIERSRMNWKRELLAAKLTVSDMYHICSCSAK